jgi:HTH-type transcriptional regulator/antitoxin HigA
MKRHPRMKVHPIKNETDYDWALKKLERYFEKVPRRGTLDAARFDALSSAVATYEEQKWPITDAAHHRARLVQGAESGQRSLLPLAGSGRGLWGANSRATIRTLRDERTY